MGSSTGSTFSKQTEHDSWTNLTLSTTKHQHLISTVSCVVRVYAESTHSRGSPFCQVPQCSICLTLYEPLPCCLPISQLPLHSLPSAQNRVPSPCLLLYLKPPSQLFPFGHSNLPSPLISLPSQSPAYFLPSFHLQTPLPSIEFIFHCPLKSDPSFHSQKPSPCLLLCRNSPSYVPSAVSSFPLPVLLSLSHPPRYTSPFCDTNIPAP